jgi:hypothetical protein
MAFRTWMSIASVQAAESVYFSQSYLSSYDLCHILLDQNYDSDQSSRLEKNCDKASYVLAFPEAAHRSKLSMRRLVSGSQSHSVQY